MVIEIKKKWDQVTVKVPATTANMGSGYDCIGMALNIWNSLTVSVANEYSFEIEGEGAEFLPRDDSNLVVIGMKAAFVAAGKSLPTLRYQCRNNIPYGRGLGSSSAGIVAGIVAGLVWAGHELAVHEDDCGEHEELLQLATSIEGHPDNVAPAIYGGLQIGIKATSELWSTSRVSIPHGLQCILFIPDQPTETSAARGLLKPEVSRDDAIFNIGRAAYLINAFASGRLENLRVATEDRLHQPQRCTIMPWMEPLITAALKAGAHAAFLSGAGSTILAICSGLSGDIYAQRSAERKEKQISEAMKTAAADINVSGRVFITQPSETGAHVVLDILQA